MSEHKRAFENTVSAARSARVMAVKAAKLALNATIKTAYKEAVERAWEVYDSRLMEIWSAYEEAMQRSGKVRDGGATRVATINAYKFHYNRSIRE
jgi:hypothetical protein